MLISVCIVSVALLLGGVYTYICCWGLADAHCQYMYTCTNNQLWQAAAEGGAEGEAGEKKKEKKVRHYVFAYVYVYMDRCSLLLLLPCMHVSVSICMGAACLVYMYIMIIPYPWKIDPN